MVPPEFEECLGFVECVGDLPVQELVPQVRIETLDIADLSVIKTNGTVERVSCFIREDMAHLCLMLSRLALMVQAAVLGGQFF